MPGKFGYVMATKMLVDHDRKVRFMYHEKPDDPQDNGWRFFCGNEPDGYTDDPDNIGIYDVNTILQIDGTIQPFLGAPEGSLLEWDDATGQFVPFGDAG